MQSDSDSEDFSSKQSQNPFSRLAPEEKEQGSKKKEVKMDIEHLPKAINLNILREKKPRLVIDHMILEDFKSYAGKQKIGIFHSNFTSVVGPNGSGKSNLIEAMLFIFGYNASWMRLNKLNQLIHNSSTSSGNSKAAVEVHFKKLHQKEDGSLVELPDFQLWIRRTVNSSSVSKYFLNGRDSTQALVKERLKGQGIDLTNNRFLILQGEVEQISQMKQKSGDREKPGLLEYLQDIIGSNQYIDRIEQCAKQYAQAEQQKHEKGQLMKLVQNELKGMSDAKDEAVKFVRKQKRIFQLQNIFNQVMVSGAREELKKLKKLLVELQRARDQIISEQRQKLKKQAQRIRDVKKKKFQVEQCEKEEQKVQQSLHKLIVQDKHIKQEIGFKSEDLVKFQRKKGDADKEMDKIISSCEDIKEKMPRSKEILERNNKELEQMKAELSKYDKPHLRQKIKNCESAISQNQLEANTLKNKLETMREKSSKMRMDKGQLEHKLKQYQGKLVQNHDIKQKISKAVSIAEKMINQKRELGVKLGTKRSGLREQLRRIQDELREHMNESEQHGQMSNMYREIMAQGFRGVIGRLGDLGEVSREYDEIITTCCNRLDNIVCTDYETAKSVLDFLKMRKLGRVTCIILDKIGQYRHYMSRPFESLPRAVRLFDVVKFKTEEAKLAFYYALNDTLYCENSDLGMEYSMKNDHQRRRVISRNQKRGGYMIIQMNGLMTGTVARRGGFEMKGGVRGKKGKDQGNLRELQVRKKELTQAMDQISKQMEKQQIKANEGFKDKQQMKRELASIDEGIRECQQQIKDLGGMISRAEGKSNNNIQVQKELKALQASEASYQERHRVLTVELSKLQLQQSKSQTKQIQALRQRYKEQKSATNKLQKQTEKERALLESSIRRIDDLKKGKVDSEKMLEKCKKEIDKLKDDQIGLQNKATEIVGRLNAISQKLKVTKKEENELKMIMDQDQKQVKESKFKVDKVKKDVENCQDQCKKQNQDFKFAESELDRIRQSYRELTVSYSFFNELQSIESMKLASDNHYMNQDDRKDSSILQNSLLNSSIESNQNFTFQKQTIFKTQPHQDLNQDLLEEYVLVKDRISGMITTETTALKKMEGSNLDIINDFKNKYGHYKERLKEFEAVRERQQELKKIIDHLKDQRLGLFRQGFGIINSKLKEVYQHLTRGGDAQLELIDSLDPFSDGVNFSVRPPKKSWKQVNKLSGGQKTLSSLSLIFALHYYKPTPLYFMDEIDAALDFKNVSIVGDYVKKRTKDAQFIIISLRNNMFDLADKLVGVYKTHDKTKTINLQVAKMLKMKQNKQLQSTEGLNIR